MKTYDDIGYARERLNDTIIRGKNKACRVLMIDIDEYIVKFCVSHEESFLSPKDIDISPVPLGYVNQGGTVSYLQRTPLRRWKQGVSLRHNVRSLCGLDAFDIQEESLGRTIDNIFPSFKEAIDRAKKRNNIAFHRDFAVYHNHEIWYKGEHHVATWENDNYEILPDKGWVRECLEEAVG